MSWVGRLFQPLLGLDINPTQFIMCKTQPNPHGSGWSNGFCIHVLCLVKKKKKKIRISLIMVQIFRFIKTSFENINTNQIKLKN